MRGLDMASDLAHDTRVTRVGPSRWACDLSAAWSFKNPSGGVLTTIALRAIRAELGDDALLPVSSTTIFCAMVPPGPLLIDVAILRRGNAVTQARAALSHEGHELGLEVLATFSRRREGPELVDRTMPDVPRWDGARDGRPSFPIPFFEQVEQRIARGHEWWEEGWSAGPARYARWFRYLVSQSGPDGALDPLALPPLADTMPPSVRQKLGPNAPFFDAPSLDLTVHFLASIRSERLLVASHASAARAGYATASVEIWGEDGVLGAVGTQTMILRKHS